MKNRLRILLADASASCRAILFSMLKEMEGVCEVRTVANGKTAVRTCETFMPHMVILEWGLPVLDGAGTYSKILSSNSDISALFISENEKHADELGKIPETCGAKFILKPRETSPESYQACLSAGLADFIASGEIKTSRHVARKASRALFVLKKTEPESRPVIKKIEPPGQVDVVLIGVSTGGPEALTTLVPQLPVTFPVPILVVQHIPESFSHSLVLQLEKKSSLSVKLAEDGGFITKGAVYFAPGNRHMVISRGIHNSPVIRLNDEAKENSCRPSADTLFRSAVNVYKPERILCVILTGVGCDGFKGVRFLQGQGGGYCLIQSEKSCVVYGMPRAVAEGGLSCKAVDLDRMADKIISLAGSNTMAELSDLLTRSDFNKFRNFLELSCGISLREEKISFARARLKSLMESEKIRTFGELIKLCGKSRTMPGRVIDLMTTNETLWFRDSHPFRILNEIILPELSGKGKTPIRIWSAACSTGQEPYSICMEISKFLLISKLEKSDFEIVGTDISSAALEKASAGIYDSVAVSRGLPLAYKRKFFRKEKENLFSVIDEIREMVQFRHFNLKHSYGSLGEFDVVFLRNVLIYFPDSLKKTIIGNVARTIRPGGYLFLGASEYNPVVEENFEQVKDMGVYYRKAR